MKRNLDLPELTHAVMCKRERPYFELIAAFDCEPAANAYAESCREVNGVRGFTYKVEKLEG